MFKIEDAYENNLQHVTIEIPKYKFVVFTGKSGSGKSSFAFDTIYMEGRRKYFDSLSLYARQFMGSLRKPKVQRISGLTPTVAVTQATSTSNPRSTVGTITEIYDYMRILWSRAGHLRCPDCQCDVTSASQDEICRQLRLLPAKSKCILYAPLVQQRKGQHEALLSKIQSAGFTKAIIDGQLVELTPKMALHKNVRHTIDLIVDRLVIKPDLQDRLKDSVHTALVWGEGKCRVDVLGNNHEVLRSYLYSEAASCPQCGRFFTPVDPNMLAFNSPAGYCESCHGIGYHKVVSRELCLGHPSQSILPKAIKESFFLPFSQIDGIGDVLDFDLLRTALQALKINPEQSWESFDAKTQEIILNGSEKRISIKRKGTSETIFYFEGFLNHFGAAYEQISLTSRESTNLQDLEAFLEDEACSQCHGHRLRPEAEAVYFAGKTICDVHAMTVRDAIAFFQQVHLTPSEALIAKDVIPAILSRLHFIQDVGCEYLQLSRSGPTLSGGESQRIRLAAMLGSGLTSVTYVLDEPSIGLHARDQDRLISVLQRLRDQGNSVLVVEHDEATMRAADYLVDFGPGSGSLGGKVIFEGSQEELSRAQNSLTVDYLLGKRSIEIPSFRRPGVGCIELLGAHKNNLKNINVRFPCGVLTCVTGVSGSGKSTLVNGILLPALERHTKGLPPLPMYYSQLKGLEHFQRVIVVDQKPIGKTPRSNPATYTKVFDIIRQFFAVLPDSQMYGYSPSRFSFNVSGASGGRCEVCQGAGIRTIEMRFLSNSYVPCEVCNGKRFNEATLRVRYKGLSISDVLDLTFEEAVLFFSDHPKIARILQTVVDVGLGYLTLGQPSPSLSGGESQRIKLSREIARPNNTRTLYVLDEPSTGLHFEDIRQLLLVLDGLVKKGNTVLVIEHNLDIIRSADYVIDLGPEGGTHGGEVLAMGTPEEVASCKASHTGRYLRELLF